MGGEEKEVREVRINDLVSFKLCSHQIYDSERWEQLMDSIENSGQIYPIIVRSFRDGEYRKYEIISGHNRTRAMKELGYETILAEVWDGLSDHDALELFYDVKLSKQSFSDWNYLQKMEAVKYSEKKIKENSRQGRRTDLEEKRIREIKDEISVKSRQKLEEEVKEKTESRQKLEEEVKENTESRQKLEDEKRITTRDKMAHYLGISTATLSKYRSIIKLPNDIVDEIGRLLDRKMITFQNAYRISRSGIQKIDIRMLLKCIENSPDKKVDNDKLEVLLSSRKRKKGILHPITDEIFKEILISKNSK